MKRSYLHLMQEPVVHWKGRHITQGLAASRDCPSERAGSPRAERPALAGLYFAAVIESTLIVLVLASSIPVTVTFFAANFSGVF